MSIHDLARRLDADQDTFESEIEPLVLIARRRCAPTVLIDVLADTTEPQIARVRALARLVALLGRPDDRELGLGLAG